MQQLCLVAKLLEPDTLNAVSFKRICVFANLFNALLLGSGTACFSMGTVN